jgi:hypothetical protein
MYSKLIYNKEPISTKIIHLTKKIRACPPVFVRPFGGLFSALEGSPNYLVSFYQYLISTNAYISNKNNNIVYFQKS